MKKLCGGYEKRLEMVRNAKGSEKGFSRHPEKKGVILN